MAGSERIRKLDDDGDLIDDGEMKVYGVKMGLTGSVIIFRNGLCFIFLQSQER